MSKIFQYLYIYIYTRIYWCVCSLFVMLCFGSQSNCWKLFVERCYTRWVDRPKECLEIKGHLPNMVQYWRRWRGWPWAFWIVTCQLQGKILDEHQPLTNCEVVRGLTTTNTCTWSSKTLKNSGAYSKCIWHMVPIARYTYLYSSILLSKRIESTKTTYRYQNTIHTIIRQ